MPDTVTIKIRVEGGDSNIFITFDGQVGLHVTPEDAIIVGKAPHTIQMIRTAGQSYYDMLKEKLRWSGR